MFPLGQLVSYGVRGNPDASGDTALDRPSLIKTKAPSPLRSAGALQKQRNFLPKSWSKLQVAAFGGQAKA